MDNKNLLLITGFLTLVLAFAFVFNSLLVNKVTVKVIEELRRSYTPGPYDPGFDPDKVNPKSFN